MSSLCVQRCLLSTTRTASKHQWFGATAKEPVGLCTAPRLAAWLCDIVLCCVVPDRLRLNLRGRRLGCISVTAAAPRCMSSTSESPPSLPVVAGDGAVVVVVVAVVVVSPHLLVMGTPRNGDIKHQLPLSAASSSITCCCCSTCRAPPAVLHLLLLLLLFLLSWVLLVAVAVSLVAVVAVVLTASAAPGFGG